MLVNNSVTGQARYYTDPRAMLHPSPRPPLHPHYYDPGHSGMDGQSHHASHYYEHQEGPPVMHPQDCACRNLPVQETFLHQILMGKGYKNDCLYVNRPMKQEVMWNDYNCCYSSMPYHNSYHHFHAGH